MKMKKMGKLTMNAGLFAFEENGTEEANFINMNFRFSKRCNSRRIASDVNKRWAQKATDSRGARVMEPHYVPMVIDPLVATYCKSMKTT